jgi:uncharacterized protein YcbK (DUF882 family)
MLSLLGVAMGWPAVAQAMPVLPPRFRLRLFNPHTGETFDGIFRNDQGPLADAMDDLSTFLRDFHCGARIAFDVAVLDFLAAVMEAIGQKEATILSAYRTPATNELLARTTFGVADNSQHMYGRALDVSFASKLPEAMRAARAMERGGVGWYPHSGFLHIDTGPVRNWDFEESGIDRLIPDGPSGSYPIVIKKSDTTAGNPSLSSQLKRSGGLLPSLKQSGQLLSGLARSGHPR